MIKHQRQLDVSDTQTVSPWMRHESKENLLRQNLWPLDL